MEKKKRGVGHIMTQQEEIWQGKFGKDYTDRNLKARERSDWFNKNGMKRINLNNDFLKTIRKDSKILEVGCNVGNQLKLLKDMGYSDIWGIEIQGDAVERAKKHTSNINIINASAFDIPFKNKYFDLVFTSGVLIHISPNDIEKVLDEIYRCSKKYIWGYEYFIPVGYEMIKWHGKKDMLWKTDFAKLFLDRFPDLKVVKRKIIDCEEDNNQDIMYLLKKEGQDY